MSHLHTTRNPMSEARRQHVHGKVLPREDGPSGSQIVWRALGQLALLCGLFLVAVFGAAVLP